MSRKKVYYDIYKSPQSEHSKNSYHVRVAKSDLIDFQRIKRTITSQCTASEGDISLSVDQLSCNMANEVGSGNRFHIEGLGYFYLIIGGPGKQRQIHQQSSNKSTNSGFYSRQDFDVATDGYRFLPLTNQAAFCQHHLCRKANDFERFL